MEEEICESWLSWLVCLGLRRKCLAVAVMADLSRESFGKGSEMTGGGWGEAGGKEGGESLALLALLVPGVQLELLLL